MKKLVISVLVMALSFAASTATAAWSKDDSAERDEKSQTALAKFKEKDTSVDNFISKAGLHNVCDR